MFRYATVAGAVLVVLGSCLAAGGIFLSVLGGSVYYSLAGALLLVSGGLLILKRMEGVWTSVGYLIATVAWALSEVGFQVWPLIPRVALPIVLTMIAVAAMPAMQPARITAHRAAVLSRSLIGLLGAVLVGMVTAILIPSRIIAPEAAAVAAAGASREHGVEGTEWRHYGRTVAGTRFSPARQIDAHNIRDLSVAWTYRMGDPEHSQGEHQVTPLQVDDLLFLCTDRNEVMALDVDSGKERWRFDPRTAPNLRKRCRGVGYHETKGKGRSARCNKRVLTSTVDARLIALDAETGRPCTAFGVGGTVDLKAGMGEVQRDHYYQTSAPLVAGDLIVVGGMVHDALYPTMPSGVVRAFDARSGALAWAWDPGNPSITREPPEGGTYTHGSPNMWSAPSYDESLGLIYVPLGVATGATDVWGGWRSEEMEFYSNSIVALNVSDGRPRWRFQTVHHDVWDYDLSPQPALFDVTDGSGGVVPALIQGTKRGQIFVLDRRSGVPLSRVIERAVPRQGRPDDRLAPTQPYSVDMPAVGAEPLKEASMWGITPFDQLWCRIRYKQLRYFGDFTPPAVNQLSLIYPGSLGGMNWGSVSIDENRGYLIVNDIRLPVLLGLKPRNEYNQGVRSARAAGVGNRWPLIELPTAAPYGQWTEMFFSPLGIPCNAPPWGTLTAVDLTSRKIVWQIRLGTSRDSGPGGLKLHLPFPIGLPTLGGSVTTAAGLVFFAGTMDYYLRAFDVNTGGELWRARLPVGAQATPMTYISPVSGRQYVVIVAGGASNSNDRGDYVVAYALRSSKSALLNRDSDSELGLL